MPHHHLARRRGERDAGAACPGCRGAAERGARGDLAPAWGRQSDVAPERAELGAPGGRPTGHQGPTHRATKLATSRRGAILILASIAQSLLRAPALLSCSLYAARQAT